jgi:hypothetical protein
MKSLIQLSTASLAWRRSGFSPPDFELVGAEGVFATLAFLDEEHTLARVRTAEGVWTLKHLGILNPVVTVREEGSKTDLATFHPHALRHGKLEFHDGAIYDWVWLHEAGPGGAFTDTDGKPLVRFQAHPEKDLLTTTDLEQCDVNLGGTPTIHSRSALLAAMGWFLILFDRMKEKDGASPEFAFRV